ncbi:lipopolysaccharide assembly protein LapA domain-containing protein [Vagococcus carniphilus]|uniref:Lipopolysaccharide assembly protein LapA domain-containing protein n=1 Tax=Vagococcus carniphilus TaxID=218144 RepID=A0AAW8UAE2_9ENTE|nr:lipopolysaccharide assembly protein LapA domain-containing protein [Vagococcus carniphilus]MDT2814116.1 lipopolysaccharide assembly protein LapA domain-containing protein [Vagococcus carniphilus]MDT2830321.1 lipopolysaccharide assembly protein LapA domain-containing protein [Vagococcus carniphilus]MDT2834242.1 lipopolysaccharide assembly protein LapA domain-containing protein [Vagococcus carniphilus]MDT2840110.1 lipopolysaccharide assembly protein LapA domain-containing protein [Vagococcus c
MKKTTKLFFVLILSFIVVLFSVINAQQIEVNFLITQISLPLVVIIIGAVIIGALIVLIVMMSSIWQKNKTIKQQKQEVYELKNKSNEEIDSETDEMIQQLKSDLKEKELELSDLRHQLVNQMMSDSSQEEFNNESSD